MLLYYSQSVDKQLNIKILYYECGKLIFINYYI